MRFEVFDSDRILVRLDEFGAREAFWFWTWLWEVNQKFSAAELVRLTGLSSVDVDNFLGDLKTIVNTDHSCSIVVGLPAGAPPRVSGLSLIEEFFSECLTEEIRDEVEAVLAGLRIAESKVFIFDDLEVTFLGSGSVRLINSSDVNRVQVLELAEFKNLLSSWVPNG